ncbi:MAG: CocE/NonD family hydrolase, partial [bacterium]
IVDEPPVTVYIQQYRRPDDPTDLAPGSWRFEETLPPSRVIEREWFFGAREDLGTSPPVAEFAAERAYVPFVGFADLGFAGGGVGWGEQGTNDAFSITYTSKPLAADLEILGFPRARLFVSTTAEVAFFSVRLCDVAPDGASTLVCKGLLNGTRREGMDRVTPLLPDQMHEVTVELDAVSWVFPKGHRIRIAISGADFPEVWPSPQPFMLRVFSGSARPSSMILPVVPSAAPRGAARDILPPPRRRSQFGHMPEKARTTIAYDVAGRTMTASRHLGETVRHPDGMTVVTNEHQTDMTVSAMNPADARATGWDRKTLCRPGLEVESTATAELKSDATTFHLQLDLDVTLNGSPHWRNRWTRTIPRRLL